MNVFHAPEASLGKGSGGREHSGDADTQSLKACWYLGICCVSSMCLSTSLVSGDTKMNKP